MIKVIVYKPIEGLLIYGKIYEAQEMNNSYEVICEDGTKLICNNVLPYVEGLTTHSKGHKLVCIRKDNDVNYPNSILELGKIYNNCTLQSYYKYIFWTLDYEYHYTEIELKGRWFQTLEEWREQQIKSILDD